MAREVLDKVTSTTRWNEAVSSKRSTTADPSRLVDSARKIENSGRDAKCSYVMDG